MTRESEKGDSVFEEEVSFKQRQIAEREKIILVVARRMFAEKGFYGTNLNDVAKEVGIARGTIYLHFPTKEDLLAAIIRHAEEHILKVLNDVVKPEDNAIVKLKKIFQEYIKTCHEFEDLIMVMSHELRAAVGTRIYGNNDKNSITRLVARTIDEGKQQGLVNPHVNTYIAANALFSLVTIQTFRVAREEKGLALDEITETALAIYFKGIEKGEDNK